MMSWDFPGGAIVKTLHFYLRGMGSIPGKGTKIPHAAWHGQKVKKQINFQNNVCLVFLEIPFEF